MMMPIFGNREQSSRRQRRARAAAERAGKKRTVRFGVILVAEMNLAKEQAIGPNPIYGNGPLAERQAAYEEWKAIDRDFREQQSAGLKTLIEGGDKG